MVRFTYGTRELRMVRWAARRPEWHGLSESAKVAFAAGLLLRDQDGKITITKAVSAVGRTDPSVFAVARRLLREAGAL